MRPHPRPARRPASAAVPPAAAAPARPSARFPGRRTRPRRCRWLTTLLFGVALALGGFGPSGAALAQDSQRDVLLERARATAAAARERYEIHTPDQPLWRQALQEAAAALAAAPDDPEALRLMARVHAEANWYIRAWSYWQRFFEAGGDLRPPANDGADDGADGAAAPSDATLFAEAGTELGFARYEAGEFDAALPYYAAVVERLPDNAEALTWLGRIHFEQGRPAEALPYWQRLTELKPADAGVAYYLARTVQRLAVGTEASDAFQAGIRAYDAGDPAAALEAFERASRANDAFVEPVVWAGRVALELGEPERAAGHWQRVLELDPDDTRAAWFLELAEAQQRWGVDAAQAFYDGLSAYDAGDLETAYEGFRRALDANAELLDAWVWAARTAGEIGRPADAVAHWREVLRRDPDDARAAYFLALAQQQEAFGVAAGSAFARALEAHNRADFAAAEAGFRDAVEANPEFAAAWGWLGRIYFSQGRYPEAATAYRRASALQPTNDDYAFFADEAERLQGD